MIYFDNAATTKTDDDILDTYIKIIKNVYANSSSLHQEGRKAEELIDKSREIIANLLGIKTNEIIFTSGASESNNLAIKGFCLKHQNRGKHIITSSIEHPSVLNAIKQLERLFGFEVSYLNVNKDGIISLDELKKNLRKDTILVSLMVVNNETGSINDVEEIGAYLKSLNHPVAFHCDATQGLGKIRFSLKNIDMLSMSAHKLHGLKGSGLLVKKENIELEPLISGGEQEFSLRAGTSNYPAYVCLSKALSKSFNDLDKDYAYVKTINDYIRDNIKNEKGIYVNSPENALPYILNISFDGKKSAIVSTFFEKNDICVSTVSACGSNANVSSYVIKSMYGEDRSKTSIRISIDKYNTMEEAQKLVDVIKRVNKEIL